MRRVLILSCSVLILCMSELLVGCHAINGLGQDIQSGGKALSRAASHAEDKK